MKRALRSKVVIVALVIVGLMVVSGVAWAANNNSPGSSTSNQGAVAGAGIIVLPGVTVEVGGTLEVAGAGFQTHDIIFVEILMPGPALNVFLEPGVANESGAFLSGGTTSLIGGVLPDNLTPGVYTLRAVGFAGHIATSPLIVVESK